MNESMNQFYWLKNNNTIYTNILYCITITFYLYKKYMCSLWNELAAFKYILPFRSLQPTSEITYYTHLWSLTDIN